MTTPLMKRTDLTKLNNPSKDIGDLEIPSILDDFRPIMMDLDKHDAKTIKNSVSVVSTLGRESKHQQPTSSPLDLMKGTLAEGMFSKKKILFPTEKTNLLKSLKTIFFFGFSTHAICASSIICVLCSNITRLPGKVKDFFFRENPAILGKAKEK